MSSNFRNKQWFKQLSQERKNEICNKFNIDENTLKRAGRVNDNGDIVIDLLRIDHILNTPEEWDIQYNALKTFKLSMQDVSLSDIDICKKFYLTFVPNAKFLTYKDNLHNNLLTSYAYKYIKNWYLKFIDNNATEDDKKFYAHQVWAHIKCLIESDLKLVK